MRSAWQLWKYSWNEFSHCALGTKLVGEKAQQKLPLQEEKGRKVLKIEPDA